MAIGDMPGMPSGPPNVGGGGGIADALGKLAAGNPGVHVMLHAHMPGGGMPPGVTPGIAPVGLGPPPGAFPGAPMRPPGSPGQGFAERAPAPLAAPRGPAGGASKPPPATTSKPPKNRKAQVRAPGPLRGEKM